MVPRNIKLVNLQEQGHSLEGLAFTNQCILPIVRLHNKLTNNCFLALGAWDHCMGTHLANSELSYLFSTTLSLPFSLAHCKSNGNLNTLRQCCLSPLSIVL